MTFIISRGFDLTSELPAIETLPDVFIFIYRWI